MIKAMIKNHS